MALDVHYKLQDNGFLNVGRIILKYVLKEKPIVPIRIPGVSLCGLSRVTSDEERVTTYIFVPEKCQIKGYRDMERPRETTSHEKKWKHQAGYNPFEFWCMVFDLKITKICLIANGFL